MVKFEVAEVILNCETKPDLFSPKGLDTGTRLLIETIHRHPEYITGNEILDWGCGWGAIGLTLAKLNLTAHVTALDSDIAAVSTTKKNAEVNNIQNITVLASHGFDEIAGEQFDVIASNPPTHRGREVVDTMIAQSFERLNDGGSLVIVVEARLKPWVARQMKQVFGNHKIVKRGPKHVVLHSTKLQKH
jgi:16S rRNA (guanine1207-N2)-methyltransferase